MPKWIQTGTQIGPKSVIIENLKYQRYSSPCSGGLNNAALAAVGVDVGRRIDNNWILGGVWKPLGDVLGALGGVLEPSCGHLEASWTVLEAS